MRADRRERQALVVADRNQWSMGILLKKQRQILEVEPAVHSRDDRRADERLEGPRKEIDMTMNDIEFISVLQHLADHRQVERDGYLLHLLKRETFAESAVGGGNEVSACARVTACKQSHIVSTSH